MFIEGKKTYTAGEAIAKRRRVKIVGSTIEYSDDGDFIGVTEYAIASGDDGAVRSKSDAGSFEVTAAGAFAVGSLLYPAADGKVSATPNGNPIYQAVEAATADGDLIEAVWIDSSGWPSFAGKVFEAVADNKTLDAQDVGKVMYVTVDAKTVTLPATAIGLDFIIMNGGADGAVEVIISPNAADKLMGADLAGADDTDRTNTKATAKLGDFDHVRADGVDGYYEEEVKGVWA